ncbi:hypothetical protein CEXT_566061 [Caerostris extrusa]|uniref:Uncharacterized protein n=1 Tax=Caerostris extrusa TaxID=172846 RepID=A0AAV4YDH9_CAEEX|nr:hypothetical protein CEXT_566061 [Caerostris extrusa]
MLFLSSGRSGLVDIILLSELRESHVRKLIKAIPKTSALMPRRGHDKSVDIEGRCGAWKDGSADTLIKLSVGGLCADIILLSEPRESCPKADKAIPKTSALMPRRAMSKSVDIEGSSGRSGLADIALLSELRELMSGKPIKPVPKTSALMPRRATIQAGVALVDIILLSELRESHVRKADKAIPKLLHLCQEGHDKSVDIEGRCGAWKDGSADTF